MQKKIGENELPPTEPGPQQVPKRLIVGGHGPVVFRAPFKTDQAWRRVRDDTDGSLDFLGELGRMSGLDRHRQSVLSGQMLAQETLGKKCINSGLTLLVIPIRARIRNVCLSRLEVALL